MFALTYLNALRNTDLFALTYMSALADPQSQVKPWGLKPWPPLDQLASGGLGPLPESQNPHLPQTTLSKKDLKGKTHGVCLGMWVKVSHHPKGSSGTPRPHRTHRFLTPAPKQAKRRYPSQTVNWGQHWRIGGHGGVLRGAKGAES